MQFTVRINGTNENPWHKFYLTQNPFPQIAKAEYDAHMQAINRLDGDPIKSTDDIESILKGFSREFIDECKKRYKPGERVKFDVYWKDGENA
jgi:hypothetical protein